MPVSISSSAALYATQLPTITGTGSWRQNAARSRCAAERVRCCALVTVDCTTKMSTPASTASRANASALAGVADTAATTPPSLIC